MKILVFEPYVGGHHTNYINETVKQIRSISNEIIVITSKGHIFEESLLSYATIIDSLPRFDPKADIRTKFSIAWALRSAVKTFKPDLVISTTADHELLPEAVVRLLGMRLISRRVKTIAITHHGYGGLALTWKNRAKDFVYRYCTKLSIKNSVFTVNPVVYSSLRSLGIKIDLLPDPVENSNPTTKYQSRSLLSLSQDRRIIGHVGTVDNRKAIPELITAFSIAKTDGDQLLIAGKISPEMMKYINDKFSSEILDESIIVFNKFLSKSDLNLFLSACDVVAPLHYPRTELSANFLNALVAGRPVIADSYGFTGMMIDTFGVGVKCASYDIPTVEHAIRTALARHNELSAMVSANNFAEYYSSDNFGSTIRNKICEIFNLPNNNQMITWEQFYSNNVG